MTVWCLFLNINNWLGLVHVQQSIFYSEKNIIVALKRDNLHCIIYYANFTTWTIKLFPLFCFIFSNLCTIAIGWKFENKLMRILRKHAVALTPSVLDSGPVNQWQAGQVPLKSFATGSLLLALSRSLSLMILGVSECTGNQLYASLVSFRIKIEDNSS